MKKLSSSAYKERPRAAGDTGGSSFSSLVRVRARQWLARSAAVSAAGSSPGAGRSATCAGNGSGRRKAAAPLHTSPFLGSGWRLWVAKMRQAAAV
ncbi:hypothetical protein Droror1_Dr00001036 [Drosera rotundifolia]